MLTLREAISAALDNGAAHSIVGESTLLPADNIFDRFLDGASILSPHIMRLLRRGEDRTNAVLDADVTSALSSLFPDLEEFDWEDDTSLRAYLRQCRNDLALGLGLADLAGVLDVNQIIRILSDFADAAVDAALMSARHAYLESEVALSGSGLTILAMGKHGAQELNYSSDIDLVAVYCPETMPIARHGRSDARSTAVKIVQCMVDILAQQTADGYVFRVDLRLRPNPSATAVAVSLPAAEIYYQTYGQNWERAAFIKARRCAGDETLAQIFLDQMKSFVWRRTLDYGAVADIHAIKKQIHAEKGSPDLCVRGADVKLGPGGIREIEFFVQTQQLLLGGRFETLRTPQTQDGLKALAAEGYVDEQTADRLIDAYCSLRKLEHRLQLREDAQTHTVPDDSDLFTQVARLMNYQDEDEFESEILSCLSFVHDAYADLFSSPEPSSSSLGSLVFTGVEDDPRTIVTLTEQGFEAPNQVTSRIRRWHSGGIRATRSARARELLTGLVPHIIEQLGSFDDPDATFLALDRFLSSLPSGLQVFSLFTAEPETLDEVLLLCQCSPEIMQNLARRPSLIEGLLTGFDDETPTFSDELTDTPFEEFLDEVRRLVNEHRIRVSAHLVLGRDSSHDLGAALSGVADGALAATIRRVIDEYPLPEGVSAEQLGVIALGRLGTQNLTTQSDLDIVFIYDDDRAGDASTYFPRLIRRIVSALSVQTSAGGLYDVDMQLRPSGGAGPAAVSFQSFLQYYAKTAWVWEFMALTKARVVYGEPAFSARLEAAIADALTNQISVDVISEEALSMRSKLWREKPPFGELDLKRRAGGLVDLDFVIQVLSLRHGRDLGRLPRTHVGALEILAQNGIMDEEEAQGLKRASKVFELTMQFVRASFGTQKVNDLGSVQKKTLQKLLTKSGFGAVEGEIESAIANVLSSFNQWIGPHPSQQ